MSTTKIKLALVSTQKILGESEQLLWSLGTGMLERGHSVCWICDEQSPLSTLVREQGLDVVNTGKLAYVPTKLLELRSALHRRGTQVIHSNDSLAINLSSLATFGNTHIKRTGVLHTVFPVRSPVKYNWTLDAIVCGSNATYEACVTSRIASRKLHIIYPGLNLPEMEHRAERFLATEMLGISAATSLYCAVGNLQPNKGFDRLIEAAHHLRWHMKDFCIAICGEGKFRPELESLIRKYSLDQQIRLLGAQAKTANWICAADAYIQPSQGEGAFLTTIQSQMLGTPVIATDAGGLKDLLQCPKTKKPLGLILAGNDPATLAELMIQAIQNTPHMRAMTQLAKQVSRDRFGLARMIDEYEVLLTQVAFSGNIPKQIQENDFGDRRQAS